MRKPQRDWVVLLGLCLAAGGLGRLQEAARENGRADLVSNMIQATIQPGASVVTGLINAMSDFGTGLVRGPQLAARNRRLEQQVRSAAMYEPTVRRMQGEIDALRRMIDLAPPATRTKVAADVIGYFPRESRLTISAGSEDGISQGAPVITGDVLVGVVSTVAANRAQVLLLSNSRIQIGALAEGDPPAAGLLRGESASSLLLEVLDTNVKIEAGHAVTTSGFSD